MYSPALPLSSLSASMSERLHSAVRFAAKGWLCWSSQCPVWRSYWASKLPEFLMKVSDEAKAAVRLKAESTGRACVGSSTVLPHCDCLTTALHVEAWTYAYPLCTSLNHADDILVQTLLNELLLFSKILCNLSISVLEGWNRCFKSLLMQIKHLVPRLHIESLLMENRRKVLLLYLSLMPANNWATAAAFR